MPSRNLKLILLTLTIIFGLMMQSVASTETSMMIDKHTTAQDEFKIYQGGTLDKIRVVKYESLQGALQAINNGNADMLGNPIPSENYTDINAYANIKKQWAYDTGAYLLAINALSYPLNDYHVRRAIAYGINKTEIANDVFQQYVEPIDLLVPKSNEFARFDDGEFYDANLYYAQKELAAAGMLDVDDDGMVEAPNGNELQLIIWYPQDVPNLNETASVISSNLLNIGLNNSIVPMNQTDLQYQVDMHNETYDLAIYYKDLAVYGLGWAGNTFHSSRLSQYGENIANVNDGTIDSIIKEFQDNQYLEDAIEKGRNVLTIIRNRAPVVPLFNYKWMSVYTDQNLDGWINDQFSGVNSLWNPVKLTPKSQATNELIVAVLPEFFNEFFTSLNPFKAGIQIDSYNWLTKNSFNPYLLIFDSPIATHPDGSAVPRASTSWNVEYLGVVPDLENDQSRVVFYCNPKANWSDGEMIIAQDYRFTFEFYSNWSLVSMSDIISTFKIKGDYEVGITLDAKDIFLYRTIGALPILPEHIWENKNPLVWEPAADELIGSGPFMVESYDANNSLVLKRNTGYYPEIDNKPPTLTSIQLEPENPIPAESVLIRAIIEDDSRIANVTLHYTYSIGKINFTEVLEMVLGSKGYEGVIPARVTANRVSYYIEATDIWGNSAILYNGSYSQATTTISDNLEQIIMVIGGITLGIIALVVVVRRR